MVLHALILLIGLDLGKLCFGSATEHIVFVRSVKVGLVTNITNPINNYIIYLRPNYGSN